MATAVEGALLRPAVRSFLETLMGPSRPHKIVKGFCALGFSVIRCARIWNSPTFRECAIAVFILNMTLSVVCALLLPSPPPNDGRFHGYPRWSWVVPLLQQFFFCAPATLILFARQVGVAAEVDDEWLMRSAVASVAGMNGRELVLFENTTPMLAHHIISIALACYMWSAAPFDVRQLCALGAAADAANIWVLVLAVLTSYLL